jgi:hypothetical protein
MSSQLKLVIMHDARNATYVVCDHNLSPEEAEREARDRRKEELPAFIVEQRARHRARNPENCPACRRDVERAAVLPQPVAPSQPETEEPHGGARSMESGNDHPGHAE